MIHRSISLLLSTALSTCLLAGCCCGSFGEEFQQGFQEGLQEGLQEASEAADSPTTIDTSIVWGDIKAKRDTKVFETPSATAQVVARVAEREEMPYYGFDDTAVFYKVVTSSGVEGYLLVDHANIKIR